MLKKRYLILLSLLIICTSIFTGAFCLFTLYKSCTLQAVTGTWAEPAGPLEAFAVYSADDTSLSFYKRSTLPAVGETYNGKTVTAVYTGIEDMLIESPSDIPWYADNYSKTLSSISAEDTICPSNIAYWFYYTSKCTNFDLKKLDTSNTTSMKNTFYHAADYVSSFEPDIAHWDTSKVTDMTGMFYYAGSKSDAEKFQIDLSSWDVSSVLSFQQMFQNAGQYASVWSVGDLKTKVITKKDGSSYHAWDVSNTENFVAMFSCVGENADEFTLDVSNWNISNAIYLAQMFSAFRRANAGAIIEMDFSTKSVTLEDGTTYTAWDLSTYSGNLYYMFGYAGRDAKTFKIDLSSWDISNVNSLRWMFMGAGSNASEFSLGDLSCWNTGNVTDMNGLFQNAGKNADWSLDLSAWDVSKVTDRGSFATGANNKIIFPNF